MSRALILDSNVLLLYLVGLTDRALIGRFKRLQMFSAPDFDRLVLFARPFEHLVLTPNTITETSNLLPGPDTLSAATLILTRMQRLLEQHGELYIPSTRGLQRRESEWLGITDAILLAAAEDAGATLLTVDAPLWAAAMTAGLNAINFGYQLRTYR